jgi:hypothetical protein
MLSIIKMRETMSGKVSLKFQKLISTLLLPVIVIVISSCNSTNKQGAIMRLDISKTAEVAVQATETLPILEATAERTVTVTPEPTATATPEPTPTENPSKNIGKFPLTLEREDIEENGLIIPFNPVDNPEEFMEYVRSIERKSGGSLGLINYLEGGGYFPVSNMTMVNGEIARYIQVMFFEYQGKYFPVVKTISSNGTLDDFVLLSDKSRYDQLSKNNVEGAKITFVIFRDMEKIDSESFLSIASRELQDLAKETGISRLYNGIAVEISR